MTPYSTPRSSPFSNSARPAGSTGSPRAFVRFPEHGSPVTGVLRYPNRYEDASFEHFERHAKDCRRCYKCHDNFDEYQLCSEGRNFARDIFCHVYAEAGNVYDKQPAKDGSVVRLDVNLTTIYPQVGQLMLLVERKGRAAIEAGTPRPRSRRYRVPPASRPDSGVFVPPVCTYPNGIYACPAPTPPSFSPGPGFVPAPTYPAAPGYATSPPPGTVYPAPGYTGPGYGSAPVYAGASPPPAAPGYAGHPMYVGAPAYPGGPFTLFDPNSVITYTPSGARSSSTGGTVGRRSSLRRGNRS